MSHMLEKLADGTFSTAYAGETPWHGLGTEVPADLTPQEMQKAAHLDWGVEKVKNYYTFNKKKIYTGQESLVRSTDGRYLTTVSPGWEPVQNDTAFEFFNDFIEEGDMQMNTAGSIDSGEGLLVWALAKVNDGFTLFGGDEVQSYLLFTNPHIYGRSVDIRFTPIRAVCNNTVSLALAGKNDLMVRLNHRSTFDEQFVKDTLGVATDKMQTYKEAAELLGNKRYKKDKSDLAEYLMKVFPSTSTKEDAVKKLSRPAKIAYDIVETQPGADYAPGTFWNAFNAVTYTTDHLLGHNDNTRMASAWYGTNRKRKTDALKLAVEMAS